MAETQTNDNTTCVVCFKNVFYYSIGECDHPVCFECSTRMRVLCLQNECPICRQDLSRVVFTETIQPYKELRNKVFSDRLFERQFKIGFCTEEIKKEYEKLLEHRCKICEKNPPFHTFTMLSDHMRRVHERYYCDLCVKHLKIFTSERRCYTRQELAHHRRKGDIDDTSHRGHPLCEFCEERFMDADELYRHLRKEHLYCHLCDADGKNLYYSSHSALAHHFRTDHYLCEEGDCAGEHLTAVFRSEIDLKAHKATVHGKGMPRGAARQARTLELQFNITPHSVVQRAPRERAEPPPVASPPAPEPRTRPAPDTRSNEQFPQLSTASPATNLILAPSRAYKGAEGLTRNDKNFPALDGSGPSRSAPPPAPRPQAPVAATILRNSKPSVSIQVHSQPASASNFRLTQTSTNRISIPAKKKPMPLSDDDFPSLGPGMPRDDHPSIGSGTIQPSKVGMINSEEMQAFKSKPTNHQPKKTNHKTMEAFPALTTTTTPSAPPQWINVSKGNNKPKVRAEPAPAPARAPAFNPVADFPTLPVNTTKSKVIKSQPQPTPATTTTTKIITTENTKSKKEKKKQNNNPKKENLFDTNHFNGLCENNNTEMAYITPSVNSNNQSSETDRKIKTITDTPAAANKNRNNFTLTQKEYPPLTANVDNHMPERQWKPVKTTQNGVTNQKRPTVKCDGMTFTNSAGQVFPAPVHTFIPPPDFELRNRALVKKFTAALGDIAAVENFKAASRAFRDSTISADDFYQSCQAALGSQLENVFPDLVALLPDIAKQQELVIGRDISALLEVCSTCGQLVVPDDRIAHDTAHWPPLAPR
ncbi:PREDICTED: zinc finger protein 598 [Papilio xuthus]|uniref:RING-type E3 ubiquitin transferase n=1 Tax=Papilio xuthus TaxID=66420 RepID=A0AAJ6ZBZ1_PAPXU|nr:PREDICTED: zinc finger protein 598 [Papilio xuthus]